MNIRIGSGFDSHRFVAGRPLVLGGVEIPHDCGLDGHSDADVLLHATVDALLGALADGDIGRHFPNDDPRWKGASSDGFVLHAMDRVRARGFRLGNLDATVQAPRLAPHVDRIRARLAELLDVPTDAVSVKAKTAEHMGALGRGEGVAGHVTVLLVGEPT